MRTMSYAEGTSKEHEYERDGSEEVHRKQQVEMTKVLATQKELGMKDEKARNLQTIQQP
jgi:hypothetical protein